MRHCNRYSMRDLHSIWGSTRPQVEGERVIPLLRNTPPKEDSEGGGGVGGLKPRGSGY